MEKDRNGFEENRWKNREENVATHFEDIAATQFQCHPGCVHPTRILQQPILRFSKEKLISTGLLGQDTQQ